MIVEGINVVNELISSRAQIDKILAEKSNNADINRIIDSARKLNIAVEVVDKVLLEKIYKGKTQGVIAYVPNYKYTEVDDILQHAKDNNKAPFIVILDSIVDPHNVGAIIRTCECAGVDGVIIPENRACLVNETVYKTSVGAVSHIKVALVKNLTRTIEYLKEQGIWTYALEAGSKRIYEADFTYPTALIIGSEGKGVSRLVKETADEVLSLDMYGLVNSLNASCAGAIAIYEVVRQRRN